MCRFSAMFLNRGGSVTLSDGDTMFPPVSQYPPQTANRASTARIFTTVLAAEPPFL